MTQDTTQALKRAQQIFRIEGDVIPATNQNTDLEITYQDGSIKVGEDFLNPESGDDKKVVKVALTPPAKLNPEAAEKITQADAIIIGPGDLYASILAPLLAEGTKQAFAQSRATIIFVSNLMTRKAQTDDMTVRDHVQVVEQTIGQPIDLILVNNQAIPQTTIDHYAASGEYQVEDDLADDARVIRAAIISDQTAEASASDQLHRSFLRHDSQKLQPVLADMFEQK
jgi:uncharacterized cofD-like protein